MDCAGRTNLLAELYLDNGMNYRLDQLGGEWMANPEMMYATLPSNMQLLEDVVDNNTSRRYNTLKRNLGGELRFQRNTDD